MRSASSGSDDPYRVCMVVPLRGPAGIFGPSCRTVSALAADQINEIGGILGRPIELRYVDAGAPPAAVAQEVRQLLDTNQIDALTGWHISAVRTELVPVVAQRIPYIYTSLYEGGEQTPGVFCTGETPQIQLLPALRWLRDTLGLRRWFIVGNNYVWPRVSASATKLYAQQLGLTIAGEYYVRLGSTNMTEAVARVRESAATGVIMFLVGQDAVVFNRTFCAEDMDRSVVRFSPLMEENMLMASGPRATRSLFVAASYFRSLATGGAMHLMRDYVDRYGSMAPALNNAAESCYEGVMTLAALTRKSGSTDVRRMQYLSDSVGYDGPRGPMQMQGQHLRQTTYMARAENNEFDILAAL